MQKAEINGRQNWLDCTRAFAMIGIVVGHILLRMGIGGWKTPLSTILFLFDLPLFFLISGFLSYVPVKDWSYNKMQKALLRRVMALLIPPIIFFAGYQLLFLHTLNFSHGFDGWWFTIVLFQMYLIYIIGVIIARLLKRDLSLQVLILTACVFLAILIKGGVSTLLWNVLCWENLTKYFQFFVAGIIMARYRTKTIVFLSSVKVYTGLLIILISSIVVFYNIQSGGILYGFVHDIVARWSSALLVMGLFFKFREWCGQASQYAVVLRFIGQRTLDIYMIHYFFLPKLLFLKDVIGDGQNIVLQLLVSVGIAIPIIAISIFVGWLLRQSPLLSFLLLGSKYSINKKL